MQNYLNENIAILNDVSIRTINILYANGYNTVGDIAKATGKELMAIKGISRRTVFRLENALEKKGLVFGMTEKELGKEGAFCDIDFFKELVIENIRRGNEEVAVMAAIRQYKDAADFIDKELL